MQIEPQSDRLWSAQYRRAEIDVMIETKRHEASGDNVVSHYRIDALVGLYICKYVILGYIWRIHAQYHAKGLVVKSKGICEI